MDLSSRILSLSLLLWAAGCASGSRSPETKNMPTHQLHTDYGASVRLTSPGDRGRGFDPADFLRLRTQRSVEPAEKAAVPYGRAWTFQGPANYGGKVMDLAVDPSDPNTVVAAYMAGGAWKTTDGGLSWNRITDPEQTNYIASVALWEGDPNVIFLGLGSPGFNLELERGVIKSTDGGKSWSSLGPNSPDAEGIYRIVADPTNADRILIATEKAVFRTINGGATWTKVLTFPSQAQNWWDDLPDLVAHPTNPQIAWVAERYLGLYKTIDGGATWRRSDQGIGPGNAIVFDVARSRPDRLIAQRLIAQGPQDPFPLINIYRSEDGGASWALAALQNVFNQGRYDQSLTIHPSDPDRVVIANSHYLVSTNAGGTFTDYGTSSASATDSGTTSAPHADHLRVAFARSQPSIIYNGNDAGVWRSNDSGVSWAKVDEGVQTNLAFNLGVDPNTDRLYLTSGDWTQGQTSTGSVNWTDFPGYEWQFYDVDPFDPNIVYTSDGTSRLLRVSSGTDQTDVDPCPGQGGRYDRTIGFDPVIPGVVYAPCTDLRRSTDHGATWHSISPQLTPDSAYGIQDFEVAPSDARVIWAVTDRLWHTADGGATWKVRDLNVAPYPMAYPQALAVDPHDPSVVYVGALYINDDYSALTRYSQYGAVKQNLAVNLPKVAVRRVIVDPRRPGRLFIANDIGVFVSDDAGTTWRKLGSGLPRVQYWDLHLKGDTIYASGQQGVWRYELGTVPCVPSDTALCLNGNRFQVQATFNPPGGQSAPAHVVPLTPDTGYLWFFGSSNVEAVVKVLDGCTLNGRFWVYAGGLTDVNVVLTVTDTQTGTVQTYTNPPHTKFQPIQDSSAFATCASSTNASASAIKEVAQREAATISELAARTPAPPATGIPERFATAGTCTSSPSALCLSGGRFQVTATFDAGGGNSGSAKTVQLTADTGYLWFFGSSNVEAVIKVLDACNFNSRFWVFAGGLTDVNVELTVTDTQTGTVKTYTNPGHTPFKPIQDTSAFATCP